MILEKIKAHILDEGTIDYVGLWMIFKQIIEVAGIYDLSKARDETLRMVHQWMDDDLIVPGDTYTRDHTLEFSPWSLSTDAAIAAINEKWHPSNDSPGEDICRFKTTQKGKLWLSQRADTM
jgi:hypothetical protein